MAISGGGDRSELRPLRRDGHIDHDISGATVVGNHKGQFAGFNIVNPRPGTVHQFGTRRDILSARQRGWWIADPSEDGRPAYEVMADYVSESGTPVDQSGGLYPEYIHLVTTEENYRRLMLEHLDRSKQQLDPTSAFLENVSHDEYQTGRTAEGKHVSTRFAMRDHGTQLMMGEEVVEQLTPRGVLREEDI